MKNIFILITVFVLFTINAVGELLTLGYESGEQYSRFEISDEGILDYSMTSTGSKERTAHLQLSPSTFSLIKTSLQSFDWNSLRTDNTQSHHKIVIYLGTPKERALVWNPADHPKERGLESLNSLIKLLFTTVNRETTN